jgi:hypothetical protein
MTRITAGSGRDHLSSSRNPQRAAGFILFRILASGLEKCTTVVYRDAGRAVCRRSGSRRVAEAFQQEGINHEPPNDARKAVRCLPLAPG